MNVTQFRARCGLRPCANSHPRKAGILTWVSYRQRCGEHPGSANTPDRRTNEGRSFTRHVLPRTLSTELPRYLSCLLFLFFFFFQNQTKLWASQGTCEPDVKHIHSLNHTRHLENYLLLSFSYHTPPFVPLSSVLQQSTCPSRPSHRALR